MRKTTSIETPVAHLVGPGKLKVVNGHLAFTAEGPALRLDPSALKTVFCYGGVSVTEEALQVLWRHEVQLAWLSPAGNRCRGRIVHDNPSAATLRLLQHQLCGDPVARLEMARWLVGLKIESQQEAARHAQRHGCQEATAALQRLRQSARHCARVATLEAMRGIEGAATACWFEVLARLLRQPWTFPGRVRRPPTDPVNALLSLGYTFLLSRTVARCEALGLEVYLGALHAFRPGRPSLACDLMEPLRLPAVDRWAIELCNEGRLEPANFVAGEDRGMRLQPTSMGRTISSWEEHWQNGGHERELDRLLTALVERLRNQSPRPGSPLTEEASEV